MRWNLMKRRLAALVLARCGARLAGSRQWRGRRKPILSRSSGARDRAVRAGRRCRHHRASRRRKLERQDGPEFRHRESCRAPAASPRRALCSRRRRRRLYAGFLHQRHGDQRPAVQELPFDPLKQFMPISAIGYFDWFLSSPRTSSFHTLGDFLKAARDKPGTHQSRLHHGRQHAKSHGRIVQVDVGRRYRHRAIPHLAGRSGRAVARRHPDGRRILCRAQAQPAKRPGPRPRDQRAAALAGIAGCSDRARKPASPIST